MSMEDDHNNNDVILESRGISKIFGDEGNQREVLDMIQDGVSKDEIQAKTGAVIAVRDANFSVHRGEFFIIMGLSGSGKSTLIRCLIRLIEPSDGEIIIEGEDVARINEEAMRKVRREKLAMVFQHYGLLPHKTVLENTEYGLKTRGMGAEERRKIAMDAIERVGLTGWEQYRPSALSGGMQQRVGLARALAHDPSILLMDEPFSGLDPLIRRQMQQEFGRLQRETELTTILVTHDLDEALMLGDRIAIMRDGEIIQLATPEELVTNPADDYVASFVEGASPAKFYTARNVMADNTVVIHENSRFDEVIASIQERQLRGAFVVDNNEKLLGFVPLDGLKRAGDISGLKLNDLGRSGYRGPVRQSVSVDQHEPISDLFPVVIKTAHAVGVVDENGKLIGHITKNKLIATLAETMDEETDVESESNTAELPH